MIHAISCILKNFTSAMPRILRISFIRIRNFPIIGDKFRIINSLYIFFFAHFFLIFFIFLVDSLTFYKICESPSATPIEMFILINNIIMRLRFIRDVYIR